MVRQLIIGWVVLPPLLELTRVLTGILRLDGTGSSRPSSTGASDILVFDGTNLGGTTPATGPATILASAGISFAQMIFTNNVNVNMVRPYVRHKHPNR